MPQPGLHALLAQRVLARWRGSPRLAPFRADAAEVENHFLHGALAPDMGFFPAGDERISRWIHVQGSSQTARVLVASATTEQEAAFAWGWLTHVLADVEIHPLINAEAAALCAAQQRSAGRPRLPAQRQAHVRVEIGIDVDWIGRTGAKRMPLLRHAFDRRSIVFLARALRFSHSIASSPHTLFANHRNVTLFYRAYLRLAAVLAAEAGMASRSGIIQLRHLRFVSRGLMHPASAAWGFLHPVAPGQPLILRVETAIERVERLMDHYASAGLQHLPDYDLETGLPLAPRNTHGDEYADELLAAG
jgi:hypothetical protein